MRRYNSSCDRYVKTVWNYFTQMINPARHVLFILDFDILKFKKKQCIRMTVMFVKALQNSRLLCLTSLQNI